MAAGSSIAKQNCFNYLFLNILFRNIFNLSRFSCIVLEIYYNNKIFKFPKDPFLMGNRIQIAVRNINYVE